MLPRVGVVFVCLVCHTPPGRSMWSVCQVMGDSVGYRVSVVYGLASLCGFV